MLKSKTIHHKLSETTYFILLDKLISAYFLQVTALRKQLGQSLLKYLFEKKP